MATMQPKDPSIARLSKEAQKNVLDFARAVLLKKRDMSDMVDKMDKIDVAYARYKETSASGKNDGVDKRAADYGCGNVFADDNVTPPIVASQVDSYVSYLTDVFLSGFPLFPVVSNPVNKVYAEQLETLLDDHASLGGYVRQILLALKDGVKYNIMAMELDWSQIHQFSVSSDFETTSGRKLSRNNKSFTKMKRLNMRNVVFDTDVEIGDISEKGDYAGYVEKISRTKLKRELNQLSDNKELYNAERAESSSGSDVAGNSANYTDDPIISDYITSSTSDSGVDWDHWFSGSPGRKPGRGNRSYGTMFERFVLYARIMPANFGIAAPQPNTPQIWKFVIINGDTMISAKRIVSAYDYLPILFGQPLEDGLHLQTQSVAEGEIPFQKAASTLFNIRFAGARRAVSDRALFDDSMVNAKSVNAKGAAAKIPVTLSAMSNKKISDAYYSIPFSNQGLENVIGDAQTIVSFSKELHGLNGPRQGQFQKGNKSVQEWDDTMAGSDGRLRLPALLLEHQFFSPMKSILVLNIFQYGEDAAVVSQRTGEAMDIKIDELRKHVLAFKISDGMSPKSKLASTEALTMGFNLIQTSPILQQQYGASLPAMFAHMMSLMGVKGLEQYDPTYIAQSTQQAAGSSPAASLQQQALQQTMQPTQEQPPLDQQTASTQLGTTP